MGPSQGGNPSHSRKLDRGNQRRLSFTVLLSAICSVALFLRLINVLQTVELPTVVQLLGDAKSYFNWATRIAGGQWYGTETFYQAPLYPYTLAVLIKLGSGVLGIRLFQVLLGTASVYLIGFATKQTLGAKVGLIAAAMYAVYPPAIYYDGIIQKTSLASFLLCAMLAVCATLGRDALNRGAVGAEGDSDDDSAGQETGGPAGNGSPYDGDKGAKHEVAKLFRPALPIFLGMVLGLLVLTRENSLLWVPMIPVWLWFGFALPRKTRGGLIACYVAGLAMVLLPVAARNASLGGEWSPTTFQAGPNFYIGNNLQSNGLYQPLVSGHETPMYERADAQRLAEQAEGRELSAREVSRFWANRSFEEIRQDPIRWGQLVVVKCFMVVNRFEVPDVESMRVYRDYSWPLRVLGPVWHFGILCPLAVWGIVITRDRWRALWVYYLLTLVMVAAVVLFFILGRYRQPLVPLLIPPAAAAALDIGRRIRRKDRSGVTVPLIAALIAAVVCNLPVHDESMLNASSYMNLGIAAAQLGDMGTSVQTLARAVQTHPEMAEAHLNLGRALGLSNRVPEAITCYRNAIQLDPTLAMADALLAESYERIGEPQKALIHYQRALAIDPTDSPSRAAIARLSSDN